MFDALLGVPKQCADLLTRLTATRAGYLDTLYTRVTGSVALAATALSNATWTNARAAKLDNLDATVSSRLSSAVGNLLRGTVSTSSLSTGSGIDTRYVDVTITSVDTTKALVICQTGGGTGADVTARLTSSTNLRISCGTVVSGIQADWQVLELN